MKPKLDKFLTASLVLMCVLTFASFSQTIAAPARPKIGVEPKDNAFRTDVASVGDMFSVNVSTSGWEGLGLYSFEFKLLYDPALLNVTAAKYPPGHFLDVEDKYMVSPVIDYEKGSILFAGTRTGEVPGLLGGGVLTNVTFKIMKAPPPNLSCNLALKDITFLDPRGPPAGVVTDYDFEDGYYEFTLPKAPVYLKAMPEIVGGATVGAKVQVGITINKLRAEDKLVALQWKLAFDSDLLEVQNVTEGSFLKTEAEKATNATGKDYGASFDWKWDEGSNFVISFSLYYTLPWPPEIFPEGSGILATITFNAIKMPQELTKTDLAFFDVIMLDVDGNEISFDRAEKAVYAAPVELGDLNLDMKINILDLFIFGSAFGSYPGHPRWNSVADLNGDGKVNILDGVIIAKAFHTS